MKTYEKLLFFLKKEKKSYFNRTTQNVTTVWGEKTKKIQTIDSQTKDTRGLYTVMTG